MGFITCIQIIESRKMRTANKHGRNADRILVGKTEGYKSPERARRR